MFSGGSLYKPGQNLSHKMNKNPKVRGWLITYFPEVGEDDALQWCTVENDIRVMHEECGAKYTCGQLEQAPTTNKLHYQIYMYFTDPKYRAHLKKNCYPGCHFEPVVVDHGASDYCLKEETRVLGPWEFGVRPKKAKGKVDWEEQRQMARKGEWDNIDPSVYIRYYGNLKKIGCEGTEPYEHGECRGYWLWGAPGTGKTTFARTEYGPPNEVFIKSLSKWWDGYTGQKIVVLDDLDSDVLGHYLKIWADKWACTGEIKGGTVQLRHTHFVVTSNYSIEELFGNKDENFIAAIRRRFKVTLFHNKLGQVN